MLLSMDGLKRLKSPPHADTEEQLKQIATKKASTAVRDTIANSFVAIKKKSQRCKSSVGI
jgi:hypothetical protein